MTYSNDLTMLVDIVANFPVTLFLLFLFGWFYPGTFARMTCMVLGVLAVWGLWSNFDSNFFWYHNALNQMGLIKDIGDPQSAETRSYAKGVYHAVSVLVAAGLVLVPMITYKRKK